MTDESDNYNDFMMSDEDMDSIEMEDEENDVEGDEGQRGGQEWVQNYEQGLSLWNDENYVAARQVFLKTLSMLVSEEELIEMRCKIHRQVLECWCKILMYGEPDNEQSAEIIADFRNFVQLVNELHGKANCSLDLSSMFHHVTMDFMPNIYDRTFIPGITDDEESSKWAKMTFKTTILQILQDSWVCHTFPEVGLLLQQELHVLQAWIKTFDKERDLYAISESLRKDINTLNELQLILQCYIARYIEDQHLLCNEGEVFRMCLNQLDQKCNESLAVAQRSDINLILHFSKALFLILFELDQDDLGDGNKVTGSTCVRRFVTIHKFYQNIECCKEEFWECLKNLEELGTNKFRFERFMQIIVGGFVLCAMIMHRGSQTRLAGTSGNADINPFDYEQLRIAPDHIFVDKLRRIYDVFVGLQIQEMHSCLIELECIRAPLSRLFDQVCYLIQKRKLFSEIAPIYSCISIQDLRQKLQIDPSVPPTRDEILVHLMRYCMQDRGINFKLDLVADTVTFYSEQHCEPLHDAVFSETRMGHKSHKSSISKDRAIVEDIKAAHEMPEVEYAHDIGILESQVDSQSHSKSNTKSMSRHVSGHDPDSFGQDTISFFDTLRLARETYQGSNIDNSVYTIAKLTNEALQEISNDVR